MWKKEQQHESQTPDHKAVVVPPVSVRSQLGISESAGEDECLDPEGRRKQTCGVFRKCNFPDGPAWIAQTNHPHAQGHTVRVQKRAGGAEGLRAPNCTTHLKPEGLDEERTLAWMRDTVGLEVTFLAVHEA